MLLGVPLAVGLLAFWRCPFAALLGVPCPGCGLTRAALALVEGDVARAVELHPLLPVLMPLGAWLACAELLTERGAAAPRARQRGVRELFGGALVALLLGVWIARFFGAFGGPVSVASHLRG
jgi:hypothetical protein